MGQLKQKFVITENGNYKQGRVEFHFELDNKAQCGGKWFFDSEKKNVYIYGVSTDFGAFGEGEIYKVIDQIQDVFHISGPVNVIIKEAHLDLYSLLCENMNKDRATSLIKVNDFI